MGFQTHELSPVICLDTFVVTMATEEGLSAQSALFCLAFNIIVLFISEAYLSGLVIYICQMCKANKCVYFFLCPDRLVVLKSSSSCLNH